MKTATANYSKNVSFTDAKGQTVFIEIEVKDGRLSICGNIAGHGAGQCQDSISPATDDQRELIEIWNTFHLNDMHAGTPEQEKALKSEEFEVYKGKLKEAISRAKTIENIINGPFEKYCEFVGIPFTCASAKQDQRNLQKVWKGETATLHKYPYSTKKFKDVILGIPEGMRPKFNWNSHVEPNKVLQLFSDPDSYDTKVEYLKSKNLYSVQHNGQAYEYGTAWLTQELPANLIDRLEELTVAIGGAFTGSPYEKQAKDFLKKHGVKFSAKFKEHAKYFQDDQEERDVFTCTFRRGKDHFSIRFGQSLNQTTGTGANLPTAYDVLACLTKSDPEDLKTFCDNFGYSEDSISARRIYKSVCKQWAKVNAFFSAEELEELQDIN